MMRRLLLMCGVVGSLLYLATDLIGGLRYEGYSFSSQMVSELMAIGAPSEPFVDPLFLMYGALTLLFGVGVLLHAHGVSRALSVAGAALIAYAAIGLTGPTLFEMHPRGTAGVSDLPHIVLTMVISMFVLIAIGSGAFGSDRRFRMYSMVTIGIVIAFGALTGFAGRNMAAGLPTPGFGLLERINIYATMLWIAMLAVTLLRGRAQPAGVQPP